LGALVVAHSLKKFATQHQLAVLITPGVSDAMRSRLQDVFDVVQLVNVLDSKDAANLAVLKRPELGITFTKVCFLCFL
jgi:glycogenin